jgi:hypothetical protein
MSKRKERKSHIRLVLTISAVPEFGTLFDADILAARGRSSVT